MHTINPVALSPLKFEWLMVVVQPGSSGSIVSGYGLDDREIEVRSPAVAKGFFL
jgi:hypothetical protein